MLLQRLGLYIPTQVYLVRSFLFNEIKAISIIGEDFRQIIKHP